MAVGAGGGADGWLDREVEVGAPTSLSGHVSSTTQPC